MRQLGVQRSDFILEHRQSFDNGDSGTLDVDKAALHTYYQMLTGWHFTSYYTGKSISGVGAPNQWRDSGSEHTTELLAKVCKSRAQRGTRDLNQAPERRIHLQDQKDRARN
jgi:hypothetical protein